MMHLERLQDSVTNNFTLEYLQNDVRYEHAPTSKNNDKKKMHQFPVKICSRL